MVVAKLESINDFDIIRFAAGVILKLLSSEIEDCESAPISLLVVVIPLDVPGLEDDIHTAG